MKHAGPDRVASAPLGHLAILASAGSGKTTRLTSRYIRLLADGDRPDLPPAPSRICAMTFTRKAAGEILSRIADRLREAAVDEKAARRLAADTGLGAAGDAARFRRLLRLFLDNLHRTSIGTMDSFIVRIAKAFPIELGIPMDFEVVDSEGAFAEEIRADILRQLLHSAGDGRQKGRRDFLEAFKKATFGHEEKSFGDILDHLILSHHHHYRQYTEAAAWAAEGRIWPEKGRPWPVCPDPARLAAWAGEVRTWIKAGLLEAEGNHAKMLKSLAECVEALAAYGPTSPWDKTFESAVFLNLLQHLRDEPEGRIVISYSRAQYPVPAAPGEGLRRLVGNLLGVELDRALHRTQGIFELMEHYNRTYETLARESGRFSFADLQHILAYGDMGGGARRISRVRGQPHKLYIDYRIDSQLDHWLLDEFQDTSDLQWDIFGDLVDELVQASPEGGDRTFFYVGDVKQAIYRWRGGNPDLFFQVWEHFNPGGGSGDAPVVRLESMARTHRCARAVVGAVNRVFDELPPDVIPPGTVKSWARVFQPHETGRKEEGYVGLLEPAADDCRDDAEGARYRLVGALLREIRPLERGLEVGILVRTNDAGAAVVRTLREECPGLSVVHEGKTGILQNELGQLMLSLAACAAHPGDGYAWTHLTMSVLDGEFRGRGITRDGVAVVLLDEIERHGFQAFVGRWGALAIAGARPEVREYAGDCLRRIEQAAAEFDAAGSRDVNAFLRFMDRYEMHEEVSRNSVRVMTVHQAKGLEFNLVILPELQPSSMVKADMPGILSGDPAGGEAWVLQPPRRIVAEHDPVLRAMLERENENHGFDSLCLLYVAMTRARDALYLVTHPVASGESETPARFLKRRLGGDPEGKGAPAQAGGRACMRIHESGGSARPWYEAFPLRPAEAGAEEPPRPGSDYSARTSVRDTLQRREPSMEESIPRHAASLFDAESRDVLNFGSAIHELLEQVGWVETGTDAATLAAGWRPGGPYDVRVKEDAVTQFVRLLADDGIRAALAKPPGNAELWRERKFDVVLNHEWVSGVFDRVVLERSQSGVLERASILDYKSNRIGEADVVRTAGFYKGQIDLYRRALATITGLAADRIRTCLLFTVPRKLHEV